MSNNRELSNLLVKTATESGRAGSTLDPDSSRPRGLALSPPLSSVNETAIGDLGSTAVRSSAREGDDASAATRGGSSSRSRAGGAAGADAVVAPGVTVSGEIVLGPPESGVLTAIVRHLGAGGIGSRGIPGSSRARCATSGGGGGGGGGDGG